MNRLTLVIGNKNYSSWSLRPWLMLKQKGIAFEEVRVPLYQEGAAEALARWSPSGLVPVLRDGQLAVWDSLAIGEYLAEQFPEKRLWPAEREARAVARSVSAEMHAGFSALRQAMPMNLRARHPERGRTLECLRDIARVNALWNDCRTRFGGNGDFLFGHFTIADAMFAPVVLRFRSYAVTLEGPAQAYADKLLALPSIQEWIAAGEAERERIEKFEQ